MENLVGNKKKVGERMESISIIGGADGPTEIFIAGNVLGVGWLNFFGVILVILLMIPNLIYLLKGKKRKRNCTNKWMNLLEQIGRYASIVCMVVSIGVTELGFPSVTAFLLYGIGNFLLVIAYWITWFLYFHKPTKRKRIMLAIFPTGVFLLSGVTMQHYLLIVAGILFGIGHLYVTMKDFEKENVKI